MNPRGSKDIVMHCCPCHPLSTPTAECIAVDLQNWKVLPGGTNLHSTRAIRHNFSTSVCAPAFRSHSEPTANAVQTFMGNETFPSLQKPRYSWQIRAVRGGKRVHLLLKCHGNREGTFTLSEHIFCLDKYLGRGHFQFFSHQSAQKYAPYFITFLTQRLPLRTAEGDDCLWNMQHFKYELKVVDILQLLLLHCRCGCVLAIQSYEYHPILNILVSSPNQESHFPVQAMDPFKASGCPEFLGGFSLMIQRVSPRPICSTGFERSSLEGTRPRIND